MEPGNTLRSQFSCSVLSMSGMKWKTLDMIVSILERKISEFRFVSYESSEKHKIKILDTTMSGYHKNKYDEFVNFHENNYQISTNKRKLLVFQI